MLYDENFTRCDGTLCDGTKCPHVDECERVKAIEEARENDIKSGHYILAKDCIGDNYSQLVIK